MKILLSAYACEPNRGSEPGIGWKWAITLAKSGKEVHVLTRSNNRQVIEDYWNSNKKPNNLYFHYYDCNRFWLWAKHHHMSVNLYYTLWLYGSGTYAKSLNEKYHFDIAHHITFGVYRFLPRLYNLGIPVVIGPVGGGEYTPRKLMSLYSFKNRMEEYLRLLLNKMTILNPISYKALNQASVIITKTEDTKHDLPKQLCRNKTVTELEIGIDSLPQRQSADRNMNQFLFVGRFIYWKGVELALEAIVKYCENFDKNAKLVFIGEGEMSEDICKFAHIHNLERNVEVIGWMDQKQLAEYYRKSCALLFPSMHDSSGNVILESLSNALPVVCLECGGPASVMGNFTDTVIDVKGKTTEQVLNDIVGTMHKLSSDSTFYTSIQEKCLQRASHFLWDSKITMIDEIYHKALKS